MFSRSFVASPICFINKKHFMYVRGVQNLYEIHISTYVHEILKIKLPGTNKTITGVKQF